MSPAVRILFAVWLMAGLTVAMRPEAAVAQLRPEAQTGSRVPVKPQVADPVRTGQIRRDFARCIYGGHQAEAAALLNNSDPVTIDFSAAGLDPGGLQKEFGMERCLGASMNILQLRTLLSFDRMLLRSWLAEEAYLAKVDRAPALEPDAPEDIGRKYVSSAENLPSARGTGQFADCIVFRDVANADALLRTMPGTQEERAAVGRLAPVMGQCLLAGQKMQLNTATVRSFVADGLWTRYVRNLTPAQISR